MGQLLHSSSCEDDKLLSCLLQVPNGSTSSVQIAFAWGDEGSLAVQVEEGGAQRESPPAPDASSNGAAAAAAAPPAPTKHQVACLKTHCLLAACKHLHNMLSVTAE